MVFGFKTLHLFAGCGGGILADALLGNQPIGAVEIDSDARAVLLARQAEGSLPPFPVWDDVQTFSASTPECSEFFSYLQQIRETLCICGGFPCQDFSFANPRGAGLGGPRSGLFFEMCRVIREVHPCLVFLENSPAIFYRGLGELLGSLATLGYDAAWGVLPASAVGAPHERARWWCLAVSNSNSERGQKQSAVLPAFSRSYGLGRKISNSSGQESQRWQQCSQEDFPSQFSDYGRKKIHGGREWGATFSGMGRMADGFSDWLDSVLRNDWWREDELGLARLSSDAERRISRLKLLGNAQVPLCAAVAFALLYEILSNTDENKD